ncbi:MAG TPA: quinone oxidoreductase [Gammaproteobacteria bacterium]|jgi:NADPH2:quinone reductase|nr:quinone oxidoreductase [Chromatiales bacterium]MCP4926768.1 quinone oxidoreductase [Gammaproteobacteria bacterium]MDP7153803.1 quinone oxidoreductase [Gammaproteobacteria bacterium]MDP7295943.1 quinone oxidoreductase [Gammaproteobacteria bacterium]MDP7660929.1 quinone oxidoreductase [Gammaproteobacteria bacterium]
MVKAVMLDQFGGPEVLQWRDIELPELTPGLVRVRHTAVGLNFIDTYHREGLYPLELPAGLGTEAAGIVEAVADDVDTVAVGDRVAFVGVPPGTYCEQRNYAAERLMQLPDAVSSEMAAAAMLKGLTAWYLVRRSYPVQAGDTVLLYAAAGGVGLIAGQWAAGLGARVIGVVSTEQKAELARANGCAEIVRADDPAFVDTVRDLTGGTGVAAVYDSIGKDTFFQSLDCLRTHGTMVTYGNASGAVEPFSPLELARRGSLFVTRPVLFDFLRERDDLLAAAGELFAVIESGMVEIYVNQTYPLQDAAQAHRDLEARKTTGSTVLMP